MSVNDSKKEQNEVKCLDEAIQLAKNKRAKHSANATQMEAYIPALKSAYAAIHQGKPFATTRNIQGFLCAFGKNVKFSLNPDDDLLFSVYDTDAEEILRRFDAFTAKYPVGEKKYEQS